MADKLNTMRVLDAAKVPYEALSYPDTIKDAEEVAETLGLPYFIVYKTLVVQAPDAPDKPLLALIASDRRLDLKALASAAGIKKLRMAVHADAERLTGLQVGGISPLALRDKRWTVFLDSPAADAEHLVISAGRRGTQIRVPTTPLINLLNARLAFISTEVE